ncbi:MAG: DUF3581 domain-containing protein [Methylococcales bacterium]
MFLKEFYSSENDRVLIGADRASRFAKEVAGDFNPLHDADAKRFCVPGDLLFSLVLEKFGLSRNMEFTFSGMVGRDILLNFPETDATAFDIRDDNGKAYLLVERSGETSFDESLIESFIRSYVAYSGPNFPKVLVPLMASHNVMINTDRPLVIYESMSFALERLDFSVPVLEPSETTLAVNGRRGEALLHFSVKAGGETVGRGFKKLVISGIREYDKPAIDAFVENYLARMESYRARVQEWASR